MGGTLIVFAMFLSIYTIIAPVFVGAKHLKIGLSLLTALAVFAFVLYLAKLL